MIDFDFTAKYIRLFPRAVHRILLLCVVSVFVLSLVFYVVFYPGTKKLMLFESLDKKGTYVENCFIPRKPVHSSLRYFTEELLAGPKTDRYRPLFPAGTKLLSFFEGSDGTLYINLSGEAVLQKGRASETIVACRLLEQNLQKNYNSVGTVVIAIAGRKVYEYVD